MEFKQSFNVSVTDFEDTFAIKDSSNMQGQHAKNNISTNVTHNTISTINGEKADYVLHVKSIKWFVSYYK